MEPEDTIHNQEKIINDSQQKKQQSRQHDDDSEENDDTDIAAAFSKAGQEAADEYENDEVKQSNKSLAESAASLAVRFKEKKPKKTSFTRINNNDNAVGNELTKLIPGYTAPMKLDTSLLDSHRPAGGLAALAKRAQETDASTAGFVIGGANEKQARTAMKKQSNGCMPSTYASLYSSFKHGKKRAPDESAGAGWFNMMPTPMTDELKTDLAVIRNRNYLDPKRFYKSADKHTGKVIQMGTVIEGSAEFYSSRLTKKQRRSNLTEEIMADPAAADYTRTKYKKMQQAKNEKARKYKKKGRKRVGRGY